MAALQNGKVTKVTCSAPVNVARTALFHELRLKTANWRPLIEEQDLTGD